jgi:hypothetical protein
MSSLAPAKLVTGPIVADLTAALASPARDAGRQIAEAQRDEAERQVMAAIDQL